MDPVVGIVVRNVYEGQTLQVELPLSETLYNLKKEIQKRVQGSPDPDYQKLIFCGKICNDKEKLGDILCKMDISNPQTFHLVLARPQTTSVEDVAQNRFPEPTATAPVTLPQPQAQAPLAQEHESTNESFVFDEASLEAARALFEAGDAAYLPWDTHLAIDGIFNDDAIYDPNEPYGDINAPPRGAAAADAGAGGNENAWRWLDVKLLLKLAAVLFLFSQGDTSRLYGLTAAAVLYYMFSTGIAHAIGGLLYPYVTAPISLANGTSPTGDVFIGALNFIKGILPQTPGIITDIVCLIASFVFSLHPNWNPTATS